MKPLSRLAPCLVASCLCACDGGDAPAVADAAVDVVTAPDVVTADVTTDVTADVTDVTADVAPFTPAEHDPLPVIETQGGPVLAHPRLVLITYADTPERDALEAHARWLVTSPWLRAVGEEYGVGDGSVIAAVHRPEMAPDAITDAMIQSMIQSGIRDGSLVGAGDAGTETPLYVVYFPRHTVVSESNGARSCEAFGGYHSEAASPDGGRFAYAVIPWCPVPAAFAGITERDNAELAVSHEVLEAATDPFPFTMPAWVMARSIPSPWQLIGAELADLCSLTLHLHRDGDFVAERSWSNAAARAGDRDPCVPNDPAALYYGVTASPDTIQRVAAGASTTFTLRGFSTQRAAGWRVVTTTSGSFTPGVTLSAPMMGNGDVVTLEVTVPAGTPSGASALVYVYASRSQTDYQITPVAVRAR